MDIIQDGTIQQVHQLLRSLALRFFAEDMSGMRGHPFEGHNFITPTVVGVYRNGSLWCEVSTGKGIFTTRLVGITFKGDDAPESTCCSSLDEVRELFEQMEESLALGLIEEDE